MQCTSWAVHNNYCSRCLSSLTLPPSAVLLDSSWRSWTNHPSPRFSQELSFDLVHVFCQHPSRGFLVFNLLLDCQSVMNLPQLKQYSSSIYYHQSSLKLSNHPDMHLIACSTKAHGCMLSVLLNRFISVLLIKLWKEMSRPHQWCCFYHPYSCGEVLIWLQNKLSHNQSSGCVSFRHSFNTVVW